MSEIVKAVLITMVSTTLVIFIYDWLSGYPASDAVKDFAIRIFGKAESLAEARLNRLTKTAANLRAKL